MISAEELFQIDFARLWAVVEEPAREAILDAAAVLRRLLIDDAPLMHQANRGPRLKIAFPVSPLAAKGLKNHTEYAFAFINLEAGSGEAEYVSLDRFLRLVCFVREGQALTVRDLIRYTANIAGGVHKDSASRTEELAIERLGGAIPLERGPLSLILAIARITLAAMEPIYLELCKDQG